MMKYKIFLFILVFLIAFISALEADTIYLKNGRSIEGLIKKENEESVVLDVGFGTVKFRMEEIKDIERSSPDEVKVIRQEWRTEKRLEQQKRLKREWELEEARRKKELEPKEVGFSQTGEQIVVNALLNKKVRASLLLDTGASVVLLSSPIAKKLGVTTRKVEGETIKVQLADGRKVDARYIILDSVNVEGAEARDVGAVVLSDDSQMDIQDGLLGMSFLNKFNFRINTINKKLILEKRP